MAQFKIVSAQGVDLGTYGADSGAMNARDIALSIEAGDTVSWEQIDEMGDMVWSDVEARLAQRDLRAVKSEWGMEIVKEVA